MASRVRQVGWVILVCWLHLNVAQARGQGSGSADGLKDNIEPGQLQQQSSVLGAAKVAETIKIGPDCSFYSQI